MNNPAEIQIKRVVYIDRYGMGTPELHRALKRLAARKAESVTNEISGARDDEH